MKNEYGVRLDSNGYAPSIMPPGEGCFVCNRQVETARHEIYHGSFRQKSKELGLWVNVCPKCHREIHEGRGGLDGLLKAWGCRDAMLFYGWTEEEFRQRFGKLYWKETP